MKLEDTNKLKFGDKIWRIGNKYQIDEVKVFDTTNIYHSLYGEISIMFDGCYTPVCVYVRDVFESKLDALCGLNTKIRDKQRALHEEIKFLDKKILENNDKIRDILIAEGKIPADIAGNERR